MSTNHPGMNVSTERWNQMMDEHVESQKTRTPEMALEYQNMVKGVEDMMSKQGNPLPQHSHRFSPENLWPDKYPKATPSATSTETETSSSAQ